MALTPEQIKSKLFSLEFKAHSLHLDTKSFAEHKALGKAYEGIHDLKDEILEKIMGYQNGKRIGKSKVEDSPEYSHEAVNAFVKEGMDFSYELYEWAGGKKYSDIENIAQSLSGLFAQTKYLLTLS